MPKIKDRDLKPFHCSSCGKVLGWTAPGEADRISSRAALYCDECKDAPSPLTVRQQEVIDVAVKLRASTGRAPQLGDIGEAMSPPLSRSRVQSLVASIRMRGHEDVLDKALYGPMPEPFLNADDDSGNVETAESPDEIDFDALPQYDYTTGDNPLDALEKAAHRNDPSWADVRY